MKKNSDDQSYINLQYKIWDEFFNDKMQSDEIIIDYLIDRIQFEFLKDNRDSFSEEIIQCAVNKIINNLLSTSVLELQTLLKRCNDLKPITVKNIPQFSNFATAVMYIPTVLSERKTPLTYKELGYEIYAGSVSDEAATKYGENHGKVAVLLDLAAIKKHKGYNVFERTLLTEYFCKLDEHKKIELIRRLCFRIPMIQHAAISENPNLEIEGLLKRVMAYSTYLRRRSNAIEVLAFALEK